MAKNSLKVYQHLPEPTGRMAAITYELSVKAEVQLKLYDGLGTLILSQLEGYREAGVHTINLVTGGLAEGLYYYLIEAGDASAIRSLTVIRKQNSLDDNAELPADGTG
ncbi:MAG: hypothetical protein IH628_00870 [Proteobacteria bacterium]|nr:hypothetical protein [Pseudomonadota bacterium]